MEQERLRQEEEEKLRSELQRQKELEAERQTELELEAQRQRDEVKMAKELRYATVITIVKLVVLFVYLSLAFMFTVITSSEMFTAHYASRIRSNLVPFVYVVLAVTVLGIGSMQFPVSMILSVICAILCGCFVAITIFAYKGYKDFFLAQAPFLAIFSIVFAGLALHFV